MSYARTTFIPAWSAGVSPSYDISQNNGKFDVLADRTSKAVDIVNNQTGALTQVTGVFTIGFSGNNNTSEPDGVAYDSKDDLFWVGGVNKVVPINANNATGGAVITIPMPPNTNGSTTGKASGSGNRTDEGCYDPDDNLVMFANNADAPPYATFISTTTKTVVAQFQFSADTIGAEQCAYVKPNFYINNVGDDAHPGGALAVIPAADVVNAAKGTVLTAATTAGYVEYDESTGGTGCNPAGLVPAKNGNMLVGCGDVSSAANGFDPKGDPAAYAAAAGLYGAGKALHSLIMSPQGQIVGYVPFGGSDEVNYDPVQNRYYAAARYWTTSGTAGGTATPSIGVISASDGSVLGTIPTVGNVHSVATDPLTGNLYIPQQSTSTAAGGIAIYQVH